MKRTIIIQAILTIIFILEVTSQNRDNAYSHANIFSKLTNDTTSYSGKVKINQDSLIKNMVLRHIELNKKSKGIKGYRINIFFDSGFDSEGKDARLRAFAVRDTFKIHYPYITSYIIYDEPNYKVYIGDFRTKTDAYRIHKKIKRKYPKSFIVNDNINYIKAN